MDDNTPIYESLFNITVSLCKCFPAFTPLSLRRERARDVFLLIRRFNEYSDREQKNKAQTTKNGKRIIRRPAGDDWF